MSIFKKQNISTDYVDSTTGIGSTGSVQSASDQSVGSAGSAIKSDLGTLLGVTESESGLVLQTGGTKHSIDRTRKTILPSVLETENLRQMLTTLEQGTKRLFESEDRNTNKSAEQKGGTDNESGQLISEIDALVKVLQ